MQEPSELAKQTNEVRRILAKMAEQSKAMGFTGNTCPECGNFQMVRNGTCEKCSVCGATTGCS